ncbi:ubiquitin binding protein [Phlegmacium glaucopus]|nr:ubiquitin binding protein [Phlegmacium glaucopus]
MASLGAWIWGTSQLDDAVDKATSELLPAGGEDIALNLEICDQIRSKSVPAKDAMRALKRRLNHKNPNVQLLALGLTDICIKNGGDPLLAEIASREFIDNLVSILKVPALNHDVKTNILRLIQNWSIAFEGKPALNYVGQVYKTLTTEGYKFPPKDPAVTSAAMVDTQTAPDWIDSEVCLRCRTAFTFTNRKHHCRNCGLVFDQLCSSKTMALPHFGITQEVRVCDGCHAKLIKKGERTTTRRHSTGFQEHRHRSARELADAELQRAIQLSLQEVNGPNGQAHPGYVPYQPSPSRWGYSEPPLVDRSTYSDTKSPISEEDDPDLKAAIEASLREASAPKPSAPVVVESPRFEERQYPQSYPEISQSAIPKVPTYDLAPLEADAILTFNQTVEQVQAQGGRDLSRYPAVTELYDKASGLRPKLALSLDDTGRKEQMLSDMHDKLSQAVKLYDQILTQQVAQPRWRATTVSPTPYQQQQSFNAGYSQWASQAQANPTGYQAPLETPSSPQLSYASPPPTHAQLPQWNQPQQSHYQSQLHRASSPEMIASQTSVPSLQYAQPLQHQHYASTPSTSQNITSYSYNQPQSNQVASVQSTSSFASPAPVSLAHSPPPIQYQPPTPQVPVTPSLARANSVTYTSATPAIARSNTVASHTPTQQYQQRQQYQAPPQQQQQQHHYQHQSYQIASPPPAPPSLPQFPVVPTATPQPTFPMYSSTGERKEALLIDL